MKFPLTGCGKQDGRPVGSMFHSWLTLKRSTGSVIGIRHWKPLKDRISGGERDEATQAADLLREH